MGFRRLIDLFVQRNVVAPIPENVSHTFEYSHPSVTELLGTYGVRSLEFDCFYDPEGGRYSIPAATELVTGFQFSVPELNEPGWKVFHIPDIDFNSTCYTLKTCLQQVRDWSIAHPDHVPIFISIEPTSYRPEEYIGDGAVEIVNSLLSEVEGGPSSLTASLPVNLTAFESLIDEILSVFDLPQIITPDEFRGNSSNLVSAIQEKGWPLVSQLRGRVLFIMAPPFLNHLLRLYPALEDSPVFPSSYDDGLDAAHSIFVAVQATNASLSLNTSLWEQQVSNLTERVTSFVNQGLIVRAFSDFGTLEARQNYTHRRDQVIAAGAHLIATDYPGGVRSNFFDTNYTVNFGGRLAVVCNPQTANESCRRIRHVNKVTVFESVVEETQESTFNENEVSLEELEDSGSLSTTRPGFVMLLAVLLLVQILWFLHDF
eukprot:g1909.t1